MIVTFKNVCVRCHSVTYSSGFACTKKEIEEGVSEGGETRRIVVKIVCDGCLDPIAKAEGVLIKAMRLRKNITMRELANHIGMEPSKLSHIEHGELRIKKELMSKIIDYTEM